MAAQMPVVATELPLPDSPLLSPGIHSLEEGYLTTGSVSEAFNDDLSMSEDDWADWAKWDWDAITNDEVVDAGCQ